MPWVIKETYPNNKNTKDHKAFKNSNFLSPVLWIRMFLGLMDSDQDQLVRGTDQDPDPSIIKQKNYVNVLSKSNKQKNLEKHYFLLAP
jgi:hypothetical protein